MLHTLAGTYFGLCQRKEMKSKCYAPQCIENKGKELVNYRNNYNNRISLNSGYTKSATTLQVLHR